MNTGQMVEDVRKIVALRSPVVFYGRMGGVVPFPEEIVSVLQRMASEPQSPETDPRQEWIKYMRKLHAN